MSHRVPLGAAPPPSVAQPWEYLEVTGQWTSLESNTATILTSTMTGGDRYFQANYGRYRAMGGVQFDVEDLVMRPNAGGQPVRIRFTGQA